MTSSAATAGGAFTPPLDCSFPCYSAEYFTWGRWVAQEIWNSSLIKNTRFCSPCSSMEISSGRAEQTVAAGAEWDQWLQQDIFLLALSHLTATERNLRALGKDQRSSLLPFLAGFLQKNIFQCSLMKTYQAYFYFYFFSFRVSHAWLLWIKTRVRAWYLSASLTWHRMGWAASQSPRDTLEDTFAGKI